MLNTGKRHLPPHKKFALSMASTMTDVGETQRLRYQIVSARIRANLNNAPGDFNYDIFIRFFERLLPVTFRDWMSEH